MKCEKGDWVQISTVVLPVGARAKQVPPETQAVPLVMFNKGFAEQAAEIGQTVQITTVIGQTLEGELVTINPRYIHDYGDPVPELLQIGVELRKRLESDGKA
ncbi:MAG: 2-amino-4-oxopentanoate thiolase subunit OrtA [Anaerolineaceae bacterium]